MAIGIPERNIGNSGLNPKFLPLVSAKRVPGNNDIDYRVSTIWWNSESGDFYILAKFIAGVPMWRLLINGGGDFTSLEIAGPTVINPDGLGRIQVTSPNSTITWSAAGSGTGLEGDITAPVPVDYGGTGLVSYSVGDILYASGATTLTALPASTDGYVLTLAGGVPTWDVAGTGTVTSVTGTANRITVGGTATDPVVDIAATYVGQTSITTLGTVATGVWNATTIAVGYGGTGLTSYTLGDVLYAGGASTINKLGIGSAGQVLTVSGGIPSWQTPTTGTVTSVSGTANRITITGTAAAPIVDIAATYVGQTSITTLGTIGTGVWQGTVVDEVYGGTGQSSYALGDILYASGVNTLAKLPAGSNGHVLTLAAGVPTWAASTGGGTVNSVSGTANRITITGTAADPIVDIAATYVGQTSITTLGTVATGTWNADTISEAYGGTNQTTYATGDILYASGANTLAKLAASTDGFVLTLASGVPSWAAASGGSGFTWNNVTGTTQTAAVNNGYVCANNSLTTVTLPTTAAFGSVVRITGLGTAGFKVDYGTGVLIHFVDTNTDTTITTGSLTATDRYASLELVCVVADLRWNVISSTGNFTVA